jgi:cytochrome c oxidase subunit 2
MRKDPFVVNQMSAINKIREEKAKKEGRTEKAVEFDYILLCNKICGNSHYNMQMTVVVDTEADYKKWLEGKPAFYAKAPAAETKPTAVAENK